MLKIMQENLEDLTSANLWRSVAAELIGTLVLVLFGCGTATQQQLQNLNISGITNGIASGNLPPNLVQIALTFGLIVGTMVWCIAHISGGHINPAVTLGALVTRRISIVRALMYVIAQMAGAMVGAGVLYGLTPESTRGGLGVNGLNNITDAQGFGVEVMITFVLVFTVLASIDEDRTDLQGSAPLTIGLAVAVGHLFSIQYTGCSMNPARSFGPAVVMGVWDNHWVFWIGPLVGAFVAAILYEYIFSAGATFNRTKTFLMRSKNQPSKEVANNEDDRIEVIQIEEKKSKEEEDQTLERGMKLEKLPLIDGEGAVDSTQKETPATDATPTTETTST